VKRGLYAEGRPNYRCFKIDDCGECLDQSGTG
jgi:hypothetical protein